MIRKIIFLSIALLLFGSFLSCAYLNTFYNAETAFMKGFKAHQKLMDAKADTSEILPADITASYDRTIAKCKAVIEFHPKDVKWHDDAAFLMAKATFYKKNYPQSIALLQQFQFNYPSSPFIPESYLFLGKSFLLDNQLQDAEEIFQKIIDTFPALNKGEEITILLAQVSIQRASKASAVSMLEAVLDSIVSDEKRNEVTIKLSKLYMDLGMYGKAADRLRACQKIKKKEKDFYEIEYLLLICFRKSGTFTDAMDLIIRMLANKNYSSQKIEMLFEKALLHKELRQIKEAQRDFESVSEMKSTTEYPAKALYELGLLFQHQFGRFDDALKFYRKADSLSHDPALKLMAVTRKNGIEQRNSLKTAISSEKSSVGKTYAKSSSFDSLSYHLAEIYWFSLQEPDSALHHFKEIGKDSGSTREIQMQSLYAQAWILKNIKKDSLTADSMYQRIIRTYPNTFIAQKAESELGLPQTILTRSDSAVAQFIDAEKTLFDKNDPVAAVNEYYGVYKKYPDIDSVASASLYAAAWVCEFHLSKNIKAFELYTILCDQYPKTQPCSVSIARLKIVKDTMRVLEVQKNTRKNSPDAMKNELRNNDALMRSDSMKTKITDSSGIK